jgi:hypothetical protein
MITQAPTVTHEHVKTDRTYDGSKRQSRSRNGNFNARCRCGFAGSAPTRDDAEERLTAHIADVTNPEHTFRDHNFSRGICTACGLDRAAHGQNASPVLADLADEHVNIEHLTVLSERLVAENEPGERLTLWRQSAINRDDWTTIALNDEAEDVLLALLQARKAARDA